MDEARIINGYNRINQARAAIASTFIMYAGGEMHPALIEVNLKIALDALNAAIEQGGFLDHPGNAIQEKMELKVVNGILKGSDNGKD